MRGYDAWLEAPYVQRGDEQEAYEQFCEERDLNPEFDHWDEFEDWKRDTLEDRAVEAAEARAEDRAERMRDALEW